MYSDFPVYASDGELDTLLSKHPGSFSAELKKSAFDEMETIGRQGGLNVISFSFYCLCTNRVVFHSSRNNSYLMHLGVHTDIKDNRKMINRLTHPDDVEFWADFNLNYYKIMMELPPDEQKRFWAIGSRRLLEKDGKYHTYWQQLSHFKSDDADCPVMVMIQTIRLDMDEFPQFRFFSPNTVSNIELHTFSANMYKLKLSMRRMQILDLYSQGYTQEQIGRKTNKSLVTVKENVKRIKEIMGVSSMMIAGEIWRMIKTCYAA